MAITLNGTTGISSPGGDTSTSLATTNLSYTGTLTGGTGVIAIGTNQIYKDASGNVGIGGSPAYKLDISGTNPRIRLNETTGYVLTSYVNSAGTLDIGRDSSAGAVSGVAYAGFFDLAGAYPYVWRSNSTERMRINTNGALVFAGGNTAASGVGIAFPATQSASSDANTLDDYEEGTWTPVDNSGAGLTFTNVGAIYTKVGRVVTCSFNVTYPTTASASGASIAGFPYPTANISGLNNSSSGFTTYTDSGLTLTAPSGGGTSNMNIYIILAEQQ